MSLYLSPDELTERTGYKQNPKRCDELRRQGAKFIVRWDGFPLVVRGEAAGTTRRQREPNYGALK